MQNEISIIREVASYIKRYRGKKMCIIFGSEIIHQVRELGIIKDITVLKNVGVDIMIVHTDKEAIIEKWVMIKDWTESVEFDDFQRQEECFSNGLIPVLAHTGKGPIVDNDIADLAIKHRCDKLIFITDRNGVHDREKKLIKELDCNQARSLLDSSKVVKGAMRTKIEAAIKACEGGVERCHIISGRQEGALLKEIYLCFGIGTLIFSRLYQCFRRAKKNDVLDVFEILRQNANIGLADFAEIDVNFKNFNLYMVDKEIHACVLSINHSGLNALELKYLASSSVYRESNALESLLNNACKEATELKVKYIFLRVEKNEVMLGIYPWFRALGFRKTSVKKVGWQEELDEQEIWLKEF